MCDFKPGDEVVCVDDRLRPAFIGEVMQITKGEIYVIESVLWDDVFEEAGVILQGIVSTGYMGGFAASRFRKVQRRDLKSWLSTSVPNTDRWDKPLPAKKRERA